MIAELSNCEYKCVLYACTLSFSCSGQQLVPHPDDSKLYVDPNSIEHEQALTGDEYAMVDMASKKAKPTDTDAANQALYQV